MKKTAFKTVCYLNRACRKIIKFKLYYILRKLKHSIGEKLLKLTKYYNNLMVEASVKNFCTDSLNYLTSIIWWWMRHSKKFVVTSRMISLICYGQSGTPEWSKRMHYKHGTGWKLSFIYNNNWWLFMELMIILYIIYR